MIVTASVLNVRSGPGTTYRVLRTLSRGARVDAVETAGEWAWVAPGEGWVSRGYLAPERVLAPVGLPALVAQFGPAGGPECHAGRVVLPAPLKLSWSSASITRFACHIQLEEIFTEVFREIHRAGLWGELREFGGCYNDRTTRGGEKKSTHAWGIAVDLNPTQNAMGSTGAMDGRIVRIFEEAGFTWGGRWTGRSRDPMHFQYVSGY